MDEKIRKLLIKDLCCRIPYTVFVKLNTNLPSDLEDENIVHTFTTCDVLGICCLDGTCWCDISEFKVYLRKISSMTDKEEEEYNNLNGYEKGLFPSTEEAFDFLLEHHFDYRGLIEKGLAIKATFYFLHTKWVG